MGTIAITVGVGSTPLPGPATAPPFARDTFTDTAGVLLQNHTPELGGPWVKHAAYAADAAISAAGRAYSQSGGLYLLSALPATAEYDVTGDIVIVSAVGVAELMGRYDATADTGYRAVYDGSEFILYKFVVGVATILGYYSRATAVGATARVTLRIRNAAKTLLVDGVEWVTSADNAITGAGRVGIRPSGSTDTTGRQIDNVRAVDA